MSNKSYRKGETVTAIATELEGLVKSAASPPRVGELPSAQIRRAWAALGKPDWWRVRAAWYGQAHEGWPVGVVDDLRRRYAAWKRESQEAAARDRSREDTAAVAALASLRSRLAEADPEFFGEQIAAIDAATGNRRRRASDVGADAGPEGD